MSKPRVDYTFKPLEEVLDKYGEEVQELVISSLTKIGKETKQELKNNRPQKSKGSRKHYADGWAYTRPEREWWGVKLIVYNKNKPTLTHLLNDGYTRRDGTRVSGDNHIDMASDFASEELERLILEELKKL